MTSKYNMAMKAIHWLTVPMLMAALITVWMHEIDKSWMVWHKAIGVAIFVAVLLRIVVRLASKTPEVEVPARVGHWAIYATLLATPVTMLIASAYNKGLELFGVVIVPLIEVNKGISHAFKEAHEFLGNFLIVLVVGHIAFALWHHYIKKDNTLAKLL